MNVRLFRGYATTAAVREGHLKVLEVLINAGASQLACEEALLEASYLGRARFAEILMQSNMVRPNVAIHAFVSACCRGFIEVVDVLIKVPLCLTGCIFYLKFMVRGMLSTHHFDTRS